MKLAIGYAALPCAFVIDTRKSSAETLTLEAAAVVDCQARLHELAGRILHRSKFDLGLERVDQLDIADGAFDSG